MNEAEKSNILLVDDKQENLLALEGLLEGPDMNIVKAQSGNEALGLMLEYDFALVLLDVQMPEMDGFETAEMMKGMEKTRNTPIIFVTAVNKDQQYVFKGYEAGAVDYLLKPLAPDILKSKVKIFIDIHKQKKLLEKRTDDLQTTVAQLKKANEKRMEQEKALIQEERLKMLLQMAGATVHELSQPLTVLLGNIELMEINKDEPEKLGSYMNKIEGSVQQIADIVKKMQSIRHYDTKSYLDGPSIMKFDQKLNILSVEDWDEDFERIRKILRNHKNVTLNRAITIQDAIKLLEKGEIDLVLLDHVLKDGDSIDFINMMDKKGLNIPVVVITGQGDEMVASQVIQVGAYDYLPKERVSAKSLSRSIHNALEKYHLKEEIKRAQSRMAEMAMKDELTGLYNRRNFMEALDREISRARRHKFELVLCMIDLDGFKNINDTYGHSAGDKILSEVGKMLKECIRHSDLICRYGGEEFAIILPNTRPEKAWTVCERFRRMVSQRQFENNSSTIYMTVSIGYASLDHSVLEAPLDLINKADKALYHAKKAGKNRVVQYGYHLAPSLTSSA